MFQAMGSVGDVDLFHPRPQLVSRHERGWSSLGDTHSVGVQIESAASAAAWCWNLSSRKANSSASRAFRERQPHRYDVVFLHRLSSAWWTGWTDPARCIVDIDDLPSHFFLASIPHGTLPVRMVKWLRYQRIRMSERRAPRAFRFSLVCSDEDRRYLGHPQVRVLPNCYWHHRAMDQDQPRGGGNTILFVGSLHYPPNSQGIAWFVREVFPGILRELPDTKVVVVGKTTTRRDGDWSWTEAPGVEFVGSVDDVAPYIQAADIEICPLLIGRGTRIKVLESLAFAKPVVSTTVGAYGLPLDEAQGVFRRDDPGSFAQACITLLRDKERCASIGAAGRERVRQDFSPETIKNKLAGLVEQIITTDGLVQ